MKKLTKIIIIVFIIVIILLVLLEILNRKNTQNTNNQINNSITDEDDFDDEDESENEENIDEEALSENAVEDEEAFDVTPDGSIKDVLSTVEAFNVENNIQTFIDYMTDKNYDAIIKVLDTNYAKEKNLNKNNVKDAYSKYINTTFIANKIYEKGQTEDQTIYLVTGKIVDSGSYASKGDSNFTLILDSEKNAYSVIPEVFKNGEYNYNFDIEYDEDNYYNDYTYTDYNDGQIADKYFTYFSTLESKSPEEAYNLLNSDYRKIRFGDSIDKYKTYLSEINLDKVYADKYTVDVKDDETDYAVEDQNGFVYIIAEKTPLDISLRLDTYTIMSDNFKKAYDGGANEYRTSLDVDKWMMMIQNKDFENAYNLLDETFRTNNFGNVDKFKEYVNNKYSTSLQYKIGEAKQYNDSVYTQTVTVTKEDGSTVNANFVVQILDNRQFVLSFEI